MARLDEEDRAALKTRSEALCTEIKDRERAFEKKNGRKLTRSDVKADKDLAKRYMEYENIKAVLAGKKQPHRDGKSKDKEAQLANVEVEEGNRKKRKSGEMEPPTVAMTPSKRRAGERSAVTLVSTPRKSIVDASSAIDIGEEDLIENQKPMMLGPTPQKGGQIVGLFDGLVDSPSKIPGTPSRVPLVQVSANTQVPSMVIPMTPSKSSHHAGHLTTPSKDDDFESPARRFSKTPMSEGKRFLFSQFLTPKRPRDGWAASENVSNSNSDHQKTPSSIAKKFETPAFLRRYMSPPRLALIPVNETVEAAKDDTATFKRPNQLRRTKSLPFKGFYALMKEREEIVMEQQRIEEDVRIDEEEDLMREMEMQEMGITAPPRESIAIENVAVVPETQYDEYHEAVLDDEGFVAGDLEAELKEADDKAKNTAIAPVKVWKKKGLKRQTRRVISKFNHCVPSLANNPVRPTKSKPSTQGAETSEIRHDMDADTDSNSEAEFQPSNSNQDITKPAKTRKSKTSNKAKPNSKSEASKTSKRKIVPGASAQPNFRALKIKNKNSKGNGRGSWGRGRR
jgi:hypothetical protein